MKRHGNALKRSLTSDERIKAVHFRRSLLENGPGETTIQVWPTTHNAVKPALARPFGAAFSTVSPDTVRAFTLSARIKRLLAMIATLFRAISRGENEIERLTRVSLLAALLMRNYYRSVKKKLIESFLYSATRLKPRWTIDRSESGDHERTIVSTHSIYRTLTWKQFVPLRRPGSC